jgi:hypothetical protein
MLKVLGDIHKRGYERTFLLVRALEVHEYVLLVDGEVAYKRLGGRVDRLEVRTIEVGTLQARAHMLDGPDGADAHRLEAAEEFGTTGVDYDLVVLVLVGSEQVE